MKNIRREVSLGIVLIAVWLLLTVFKSVPFLLTLVGIAGLVLIVVGVLPEPMHDKLMGWFNGLTGNKKN